MPVCRAFAASSLLALALLPGVRASAAEPAAPIEETVRAYTAEHMADAGVPGMVFVMADTGGIVFAETFGSADISTGRPMTVHTPLRVGSVSKPVTAALALELSAAGRLDLDVPVDRYLGVELSDRYGPAGTVRWLLQHRGGYPDAIVRSHHLDPEEALELDEWVEMLPARSFAPDVVASYSSVGYTLAGAAMAAATGTGFAELAAAALFEPLGMSGATFGQPPPPDVAVGYSWGQDGFAPYPLDVSDLVPGVGLVATGADIGRFMSAVLAEDGPLSAATRQGLLAPAGPHPGLRSYTTGLTEWRYGGRSVLYQEGNGIGTSSRMMLLPDEGVGFFTAVNGEALVGAGRASTQARFVRGLHELLIRELYPGLSGLDPAPLVEGAGRLVDPVAGVYVPTRVDTWSVLRLEALISQFQVDGDGQGMVFLEGPDGVVYATTGGTGSFRQAAWWETTALNLAVIGGSILLVLAGLAIAVPGAPRAIRRLMLATGVGVIGFMVCFGYAMATVDAMDLFTGLTLPIRIAQVSVVGMVVAAAALVATTVRQAQRDSASIRVVCGCAAIALAAVMLGAWAWIWRVLPL